MTEHRSLHPASRLVHPPQRHDTVPPGGEPIFQQSMFPFEDFDTMVSVFRGEQQGYFYTRARNPNFESVESVLAELEGAERAVLFSSGMAAISAVMLELAPPGSRLVIAQHLYGGTVALFNEMGAQQRHEFVTVDFSDLDALARALEAGAAFCYFETPTNPHNYLVDLKAVADIARRRGVPTVVDNTFATPLNQRPIEHGIDLVVHSGTKYLAGHSDLVCGAACGSRALMARLRRARKNLGGMLNGIDAWLLSRGMKTLALRIERHNANALVMARHLSAHPRVRQVFHPWLATHPGHELALRQMQGGGGVVSFRLDGAFDQARAFLNALRLIRLGASLGGVESLANLPAYASHLWVTPQQRQAMGIDDSLVRLSVGIEHAGDLQADVDQALAAAFTHAAVGL